jgi:predicted DCC family thiol-disulfide oxidoreductase YuxK
MSSKADTNHQVVCFHDGECPICRVEVDMMKKLDRAGNVQWVDISQNKQALDKYGLSYDEAMKSMHVFDNTKQQLSNDIDGFLLLWQQLPYYRKVAGWVSACPTLKKLLTVAYRLFAKYRLKISNTSA